MTDCQKYEMFINEHTDILMKYMIWENEILPRFNNIENGTTDITDADFDIID